ncbi:acyl carrier protein [Paenibacillus sp. MER 180]|uniref:acyl carrier protein n=1 Tax=unclassified Paenibacillus TaxID=185978 RepID=UPI0008065CD6|nr:MULTISPECIES: acyl carrier protein [unclassified Paenibacillus]MCM3291526.1 acyl carrier protein [Paenibacillus sp. MER 180]OBY80710.1 acyl carrier protein [Paenibacillus sp. KS1]
MTRESIFQIIVEHIREVLPELAGEQITLEDSLRELGANSVDRMEILVSVMQSLGVKIPMVNFGKASNIGDLVRIFQEGN